MHGGVRGALAVSDRQPPTRSLGAKKSAMESYTMNIREAVLKDNDELQELQAKCPQGTTLVVSTVNTPDFFARAKVYESYKVFVACEGNRIIGSAACALRNAIVNGKISRIGYIFQAFTAPDARRKGVATRLLQQREDYLRKQGAVLVYTLIMESNLPSMKYVENQGFNLHRTLVMPALVIRKEIRLSSMGRIRPITSRDLATVAELLNETWQGFEFYESTSAEALAQFINRTPAYSFDSLLVLEDRGEVLACLGFWDWSQVMRITVKALSLKMQMIGFVLTTLRILPEFLKPGDIMKQIMLTPIGFKDSSHLAVLVRYLNNQALLSGIQQIFCICERGHMLLRSMKGFIRVNTAMHLYVKRLHQNISLSNKPVFIDGIDI
jgi:N-acetylglutamate synthase-like GNAT family acetyltransferase